MTFGERLRDARKTKRYTQRQLAELIGAKHNSVSDWENNKNKPDPNTIELICGALDISPNYLLASSQNNINFIASPSEIEHIKKYRSLNDHGKEVVDFILEKEYQNSKIKEINPNATRLVNYYYKLASAGTGQIIFDTPPTKSIEVPDTYKNVDYAIGVNGDSMEPVYSDGDTLLVQMTNDIEIGDIGIFQIDGQCYVKKLGDGKLISVNPKYDNIPLNESASCMGKVIDKL